VEDISDETLMRRHEKYELEERKKFRSYVLPGYNISRRAHKRTDSRAESSGANTPGKYLMSSPGVTRLLEKVAGFDPQYEINNLYSHFDYTF
jgi:hypothetical protein